MTQTYSLSGVMPTIPTPHDCVIERISRNGEYLVFDFEQEITNHDSARFYCPTAKSLTMRFHLIDTDFGLYEEKRKRTLKGRFSTYIPMDSDELFHLTGGKRKLEYLYHYVAYNTMILRLWAGRDIYLKLYETDQVELNWIE